MADDDLKLQAEELAGGLKIKGEDIDFILVVKKGHAKDYPYPVKQKEDEKKPEEDLGGTPKTDDELLVAHFGEEKAKKLKEVLGNDAYKCLPPRGQKPEEKPPEAKPDELKEELAELKALKTMLSNKVIEAELKANSDLDVKARTDELMKMKLSELTKLIQSQAPGEPAGYETGLTLAGSEGGQKKPESLRDLIELGLKAGVL